MAKYGESQSVMLPREQRYSGPRLQEVQRNVPEQISQPTPEEIERQRQLNNIKNLSRSTITKLRELGITKLGTRERRQATDYLRSLGYGEEAIRLAVDMYGPQFRVFQPSSRDLALIKARGGTGFTGKVEVSQSGVPQVVQTFYRGTKLSEVSAASFARMDAEVMAERQKTNAQLENYFKLTDTLSSLGYQIQYTPEQQKKLESLGVIFKQGEVPKRIIDEKGNVTPEADEYFRRGGIYEVPKEEPGIISKLWDYPVTLGIPGIFEIKASDIIDPIINKVAQEPAMPIPYFGEFAKELALGTLSMIPKTAGEAAITGGEIALGIKAFEFAPLITSLVFAGLGTKSISDYPKAETEVERGKALVGGILGFLPLAGEAISGFKLRDLEIPKVGEEPVKIKLFGYETKKGRAFTILSKTPEGFKLGTPDVSLYLKELPVSAEIKLGSALETKAIQKGIELMPEEIKTERAIELIDIGKTLLRQSLGVKSKFIDESQLYSATERLPEEGVKVILELGKEEGAVLFGSKSRATQLMKEYILEGEKFELIKVPRDIELRFDALEEEGLQPITKEAIKRLKELGTIKKGETTFELGTTRQIIEKGVPEMAIEAKIDGEFIKVAEFKAKGNKLEGEEVPEFVVGIKKTGKTMKIQDIELTRLEEELRGVAQGVLRVRIEKETGKLDIYPSPKRLKDIGSVSVSARTLAESKFFNGKLSRTIEQFESLFPEGLVREQVQKVILEDKEVIADFRKAELEIISPKAAKRAIFSSASYTFFEGELSDIYKPFSIKDLSASVSDVSMSKSRASVSPSLSPDLYVSTSPSLSKSKSPSMSASASASMSPSASPSISPSLSPDLYPSASTSASPSISPIMEIAERIINYDSSPFEGKKKYGKSKDGFNVYVKAPSVGGKNPKLIKINKEPLARGIALDEGAYVTDTSLARRFILKKAGKMGSNEPNIRVPRGYFEEHQEKFREFKIKKGKKLQMVDEFIEKSGFALDTPQETAKISAAKRIQELSKKGHKPSRGLIDYAMSL